MRFAKELRKRGIRSETSLMRKSYLWKTNSHNSLTDWKLETDVKFQEAFIKEHDCVMNVCFPLYFFFRGGAVFCCC